MTDDGSSVLLRLTDSGWTVADPMIDVRGRVVLDQSGAELGTVEELLVDARNRRIRFLRVVRGGILGFGVTPSYVPAAVVTHLGAAVHVRTSGNAGTSPPVYDPELTSVPHGPALGYRSDYAPYWVPGCLPPPYVPRRRG